jgi:hypothetical protein
MPFLSTLLDQADHVQDLFKRGGPNRDMRFFSECRQGDAGWWPFGRGGTHGSLRAQLPNQRNDQDEGDPRPEPAASGDGHESPFDVAGGNWLCT